jgi:hypothetical protein
MQENNQFKKALLFFNASSFRLATGYSNKNSLSNQQLRVIGVATLYCIEFSLIESYNLYIHQISFTLYKILLILPLVIHGGISFVYAKDLEVIAGNYNGYYKRVYFYSYCFLVLVGVFFLLYLIFYRRTI